MPLVTHDGIATTLQPWQRHSQRRCLFMDLCRWACVYLDRNYAYHQVAITFLLIGAMVKLSGHWSSTLCFTTTSLLLLLHTTTVLILYFYFYHCFYYCTPTLYTTIRLLNMMIHYNLYTSINLPTRVITITTYHCLVHWLLLNTTTVPHYTTSLYNVYYYN